MQNRAAKAIATAAVGLFLLTSSPKAFSQSKMAPEPIKKEASNAAKKGDGRQTLCLRDTADLAKIYGSSPKIKVFSQSNVKIRKNKLFCTGATGSFSGRLYGGAKPMPISVRFTDCSQPLARKAKPDAYAYLPEGEKPAAASSYFGKSKPRPSSQKKQSGFRAEGFYDIRPISMSAGASFYTNEYGMPSIGVLGSKGYSIGRHMAGQIICSGGSSLAKATRAGITDFKVNPSNKSGSYAANSINCNTLDVFLIVQFDVGQFDIRLGRKFDFTVSFLTGPLLNMSIQRGTGFSQEISVSDGILANGEGNEWKYSCFVLSAGGVLGFRAVIADSWELSVKEYLRFSRWRDGFPIGDGEIGGYSVGKGDQFSRFSTFVTVSYIIK